MTQPRAVVLHRRTELTELLERHGTRGQVEFFLDTRGRSLAEVEERHRATEDALAAASRAIPMDWRRARVERAEVAGFVFGPEDIVVAVGQDGLVANAAKYLAGQPVLGVDPAPGENPGVLVPHRVSDLARLLPATAAGEVELVERTMVQATTDDGQGLTALNELFLGQPTHQTARYRLGVGEHWERQASSGLIVGTGTGASGWCASLARVQGAGMTLPAPADPGLAWFVREAWPSPSTGTALTAGTVEAGESLRVEVESDRLVLFGDGIEADHLGLTWGQRVSIGRAPRTLRTVR